MMSAYLPQTHRDPSADAEARLADQVRQVNPMFAPTRVDFGPFQRLRAKIDCITIAQGSGLKKADLDVLRTKISGKIVRPNNLPHQVTIHDPTPADLKHLTVHYPHAHVYYIEIAVDIFLPHDSNDLYLLRQVKEQIRHCMSPQKHARFKNCQRKYYSPIRRNLVDDTTRRPAPLMTVYFDSRRTGLQTKLYLKTIDQGNLVPIPHTRIEFSLKSAAPEWAGLETISDLPVFSRRLRTSCSDAFRIFNGFKGAPDADLHWARHGASWGKAGAKGLTLKPDPEANRQIGNALNDLSRKLVKAFGG
jgi:hypothetical protein